MATATSIAEALGVAPGTPGYQLAQEIDRKTDGATAVADGVSATPIAVVEPPSRGGGWVMFAALVGILFLVFGRR